MSEKPKHNPISPSETIHQKLSAIQRHYKERINGVLTSHFGLKEESEILELFSKLSKYLSSRNQEILGWFEQEQAIDFHRDYDFSWGIKIPLDEVALLPESSQSFLTSYARIEGNQIYSRGYAYYFNLDGLTQNWGNLWLDQTRYTEALKTYLRETQKVLGTFQEKSPSTLALQEKKMLKISLEHYKNILFFLQNALLSMRDPDYVSEHLLNVSHITYENYFHDVSDEANFTGLNTILCHELEKTTQVFCDLVLNLSDETPLDFTPNPEIETALKLLESIFWQSFQKQSDFLEKINSKQSKGKQSDIKSLQKAITKGNNKLIGKLIRVIREEDNPVKELLSAHNIAQSIPQENQDLNLVGVLYGGIEMPYIMKYVLTRFFGKDPQKISIEHLGLSAYSNRNLRQTSTHDNYSLSPLPSAPPKLQIVLDDNAFFAWSLQVAANTQSVSWPVYSWVAEIGLRRKQIGKLSEWASLNFFYSKVADASATTPIEKHKGTYRNMVNKYILKKLKGLVGNL